MGASVRVLPPPPAEVTESVELSSSALIPIGPPPLEEMTASLELVALGGDEVTASIQTPLDVAPLAEVTESVELMPLDVAPRLAEVTESVELLPLDVLRRAEEVTAQINPGPAPALPSFAALPPVPRLPFASAPRATSLPSFPTPPRAVASLPSFPTPPRAVASLPPIPAPPHAAASLPPIPAPPRAPTLASLPPIPAPPMAPPASARRAPVAISTLPPAPRPSMPTLPGRHSAPPVEVTRVLPLAEVGEHAGRGMLRDYLGAVAAIVVGAVFVVGLVRFASDGAPPSTLVIGAPEMAAAPVAPPPAAQPADAPIAVSELPVLPAPEAPAAPEPAPLPVRPAAPATAWATLSLNSIPISKVVLDGRPLGSTPKLSVRVKAGNHSVVFIGPGGRVARSVSVASGGSKTVAVRLPRD